VSTQSLALVVWAFGALKLANYEFLDTFFEVVNNNIEKFSL
jgi:hypothetical protein